MTTIPAPSPAFPPSTPSAIPSASAQTLTVTGRGSAPATPDQVRISIGIEAQRATVRDAYAAAGEALTAVQAQLLAHAVPREHISSSGLDVRADTHWEDGKGSVVSGYTVLATVQVTLRYDAAAQEILAAVVEVGHDAVRLGGLNPVLSDPTAAHDAARALAWADALRAAELYAHLAQRTLGAVVTISEGSDHAPRPGAGLERGLMASAAKVVPLEPGQSTVGATVTVTWSLS